MDTRALLASEFDKEITSMFKEKTEIRNFLLNHERKDLCINNLVTEVRKSEINSAFKMNKEHVITIAKEYAKTFSSAALKYAEEQAVSSLERERRIRKAEEAEEVANMFNSEDHSESL